MGLQLSFRLLVLIGAALCACLRLHASLLSGSHQGPPSLRHFTGSILAPLTPAFPKGT